MQFRENNEKNRSPNVQRKKASRDSKRIRREDAAKTELLKESEITLPPDDQETGTTPLDTYETAPLGARGEPAGRSAGGIAIEILEEVMLIQSDETLR